MTKQTLSGINILDFTWHIAGPYCTKLFADYGADVIKVERPVKGDPSREIGPFLDDDPNPEKSILFSHLNLNKKSITVDLKNPEKREDIKKLIKVADILVESFSPGVMARLGLDYENVKKINPKIIYTSISNFGQSGPFRDFELSELVLTGLGPDMYSTGIPGRHPLKLGGDCQQYQVGHMAAAATIAAYWLRMKEGIGQYLDISLQEVLATDTDHKTTNLLCWAYSGNAMTAGNIGRYDPREIASDITPSGVFPCKDGFVRVAGGFNFWDRFIKLFPELADQYEFPQDILNLDNKPAIDALWYDWCADHTKKEIMEACQKVKYFGMAINTPKEGLQLEQFKERGYWIEVDHPITGKRFYPGDPLHAEGSRWIVRSPAPLLGQHNRELFENLNERVETEAFSVSLPGKKDKKEFKLPLEGVRIIDLTVVWAGTYAAWLLGCLGAEVIHVENPHHFPDFSRMFLFWPPPTQLNLPSGRSNYPEGKVGVNPWNRIAFSNRALWNRLSCCIDIAKPEGKAVFKRLIKKSDVFIENNGSNAMEKLGLDHNTLLQTNPGLICINMPAWGRSGPIHDYVGWGAMHQALSGEEWLRGYDDDDHPMHNTFRFHMDSAAAPMAVFGAIMGLIQREKTGKGQWIDFAQMEATLHHFGEIYMDAAWNNRDHKTRGNRHPVAVQGCYRCRGPEPTMETVIYGGERWLNITINNDNEWKAFCNVIGNPDWTKDKKYSTQKKRHENHDEIDKHIENWTRTRDNFEAFYVLQNAGISAGPVYDYRDTHMCPQLNFRNFFQTISSPDVGTYRYPGFPWKFSKTPLQVRNPVARLGEHNDYVYKEVIGLNEKEIAELSDMEVIGDLKYDWAGPMPEHIISELDPKIIVV